MTQLRPQMAVKKNLALMPLETRVGPAAFEGGKVGGLEFLDQPAALVIGRAAVEPPRDQRRPIFNRPAKLQMDFAAVIRAGGATLAQDARVQFRAQAKAMPAFAALKTDSGKAVLLRQFPHRDLECFRCRIKFQSA